MDDKPMLQVDGLTVQFDSLLAVNKVSFCIQPGEIVGLIGPNGAGKTTIFNAVTGLVPVSAGKVFLLGKDITHMVPSKRCVLGMSRTFQVTRAFTHMTVEDTVRVGAYNRANEKTVMHKTRKMIEFCELEDIQDKVCGDLGLASLRRVELARALATEPQMLLLDEAGAGLTDTELGHFMDLLRAINQDLKVTLCVVEHVMKMVMGVCGRIFVLDSGELIGEGTPAQIITNEKVIEAYLGK